MQPTHPFSTCQAENVIPEVDTFGAILFAYITLLPFSGNVGKSTENCKGMFFDPNLLLGRPGGHLFSTFNGF